VSAEQVAEKAEQTTGLLKALAREDRLVDPSEPRTFVTATFREVQRCWQERDYGPVERFLMPSLLADHQKLLRAMRSNGEINRIEDLQVRRLEFVHLVCPDEIDGREVTALITFEAKVYFVAERTGAFLRGAQQARLYQEFWTFRQQENAWRLQAIERSHVSNRLRWPNRVEGQRFEPA
jgi:predicted lipid-binding transport protein (Tim44 family)